MMSDIELHQQWSSIAHWPTTLVMSFEPITLCDGSFGRRCQTRRTTISTTSTTICWHTSTGSLLNSTSKNWVWRCSHFQELGYKKAKANKINREKKTLLHHSSSRPFLYRIEAGSKFLEIDVFGDIYVLPGDELAKSLHESASQLPPETPIESVDPPEDAGFQILTDTLDQTIRRRLGTYCMGIGNTGWWAHIPFSSFQSKGEVTTLTAKVAGLRTELTLYKI
ncbi:hypothetical protein D8674_039686 [Pyrus ussuriensis x Pyrus communis]|uniref:Uncharacterized protein n=1 Tax=Pyrus ussuriensis x Pyrus communis TaxID=2448454 RepID=A0A5N5G9H4_9ROSA|nr:hypothetical protein D8674_039686 [Pyrus ussuriensis x Pyrus communis]